MDKTPIRRTNLCLSRKKPVPVPEASSNLDDTLQITHLSGETCTTSTPVVSKARTSSICDYTEDSPVYLPLTQEVSEDIDVVWDWNSPRGKNKQRVKQKRLLLTHSPKLPIKRHPSNNQIQNFEKIREELQALREQISIPDNEECLILSPQEEAQFKDLTSAFQDEMFEEPKNLSDDFDDPFNDSVDEQLDLLTQKVEESLQKKVEVPKIQIQSPSIAEDSFDCALKSLNDEDVFKLSQKVQYADKSDSGKVQFHRTQSFEMATARSEIMLPKSKLDEIEKNRQEALAKLRRKQQLLASPKSCSPEEIEKKRQEALAKLNKRNQDNLIEQKRQEAIKRLQQFRLRTAGVVKRL